MADPLAELITLLRPSKVMGKSISGAGKWGVRYAPFGHPGFCVVTDGACRLQVDGAPPLHLEAGDFVFLPATPGFVLSGFEPVDPQHVDPAAIADQGNELRHGSLEGEPDVRMLGGYFVFDSPDTALLVALLPPVVHVPRRGSFSACWCVSCARKPCSRSRGATSSWPGWSRSCS